MILKKLAGAGLLGLGLTIIGCEAESPGYFDPKAIQEPERSSAQAGTSADLLPLPTTRQDAVIQTNHEGQNFGQENAPTTMPDMDSDPIVRMSLSEIIHRAVANNHDVRVAAYQPAIDGARVIEATANFDPAFFTNLQFQQKRDLTGGNIFNSFSGAAPFVSLVNDSDIGTFQTGFTQNMGSGGQIQLQYESTYNYVFPQQTLSNPFYQSDLTLSVTQPLLKNFGYDVNHAQIIIDRDNQKVSLLEFRKSVEQNTSDIEKAYWQLVQTVRDIEIQEDLVAQTETTYNLLYNRMQRHVDVSQLQVSQTQTQLELRRSQLIQFKSQARDLSDQIKALMSDPDYPVSSPILILPADDPVEDRVQFDYQDEITTAMDNRWELGEAQIKVDAAITTIGVAKNNLLPEFDFIGSFGPEGAAGNLGDAVKTNADFNHIDFGAGFKMQVPIGDRAPEAIYRRSLLQHAQAIESYRAAVEQVALDVKTAGRAVDTAWEIIRTSRLSRFAAEDALARINRRQDSGEPLTPEFVQLKLQIQDSLAEAKQAESEAVSNYNIALADMEKAKGTLLRYNNVVLQEATLKTQ